MQRNNLKALALCAVLLGPQSATGDEVAAAALNEFIQPFVDLAMFDGTVLVDIGGQPVFHRSFGYAQYEFSVAHEPATSFRIGSVSKALTDAAIARLVDTGALSLDARVAEFLPRLYPSAHITIRHLLQHSSGIPHTNDQAWGDGSISLSHDEILSRLAQLPLDFEPGTERRYSNGGYAVLAKIIGTLTGGSYADGMRKILLAPLKMDATAHLADSRTPIPRLATGYEPGTVPGERRHSRFYAVETRPGGGSLYATAGDLLRFARATLRGNFLSERQREEVLGLDDGLYLSQGRSPGFVAKLYYDPGRDIIVISLANNYAVPAGWAAKIASLALGENTGNPWPAIETAAPHVATDDPRIGRFRSSFGDVLFEHKRSADGYLLSYQEGQVGGTALIPLADGAYLQPLYFQKCTQEPDTRAINCAMLSGDPRYTSVLTPIP